MEYGNFGGIKKRLALFLILLLSFSQPLSVLADVKLTDSIDNEELMDSQEALSEEDIVETSDAISDIEENILSGSESDEQKDVLTDEAELNVIKEELTEDQDLKPVSEDSLDKLLDSIYNDPSLNDNEKEKKIAEIKAGYEPSEGASSGSGNIIGNEWLEFCVLQNGKYTIGTIEGNPNYTSDNRKLLLFGHPSPWSSETLIRIVRNGSSTETIFNADNVRYDYSGKKVYADMNIDRYGLVITQTLEFVTSGTTGRADTVKISYSMNNTGGEDLKVGIRIMLDTMLNNHDDAPFKVPGSGNLTTAREYTGSNIQQTYQVYDMLNNPTTMAMGTLWQSGDRRPDKVQFCSWGGIKGSSWNYSIGNFTFGDSAVGIYFNPTDLASGSTSSVCTYYGTGLNITEAGSGIVDVSRPIGSGEFMVYITDAATNKPIEGVTVTPDSLSSGTTDKDGRAVLTGATKTKTRKVLTISKEGYETRTIGVDYISGKTANAAIRKTGEKVPIINSVTTQCSNTKYKNKDLLKEEIFFNSNKTSINSTKDNTDYMQINVDITDYGPGFVFQLVQDDKVIMQNNLGNFTIPVIRKDALGQEFKLGRLNDFEEGKKIYLRVIAPGGIKAPDVMLGLKVSAPSAYSTTLLDKVDFSSKIDLDLPDEDIICILMGKKKGENTKAKAGVDPIPIHIECDQDGKVKVAITSEKKIVDWDSFKGNYEKAVLNRSSAAKAFGGSASSFGVGNAKVDISFTGYGEGFIENGEVNIRLGIVASAKGEASYTHTFFVGWVPLYIKVGAELEIGGQFEAAVVKDSKLTLKITQGKFEPSFALYAELGAGVEGLLSGGVQGKGTLKYSHDFKNDYRTVTLQGKASVEVHLILYHNSFEIAQHTWTLYDNYAPNESSAYSIMYADQTGEKNASHDLSNDHIDESSIYSLDSYELTPRDYLNEGVSEAVEYTDAVTGVYSDARPVVVKTGDEVYKFWIDDITDRSELNRTALVYSYFNGTTWSDRTVVNNDDKADHNFDVIAHDNKVYVTWQHSRELYTSEDVSTPEMITKMLKDSDVYYTELQSGAVSGTIVNLSDSADTGDLLPKIALDSSNAPTVVWYTNTMNAVIADGTKTEEELGSTVIHSRSYSGSDWQTEKTLAVTSPLVTAIDAGTLNGKVACAFAVDKDNNYFTVSDREMYFIADIASSGEPEIIQASENTDMDENPQFARINGNDALFWYADKNYAYKVNSEVKMVFNENNPAPDNIGSSFSVIEGSTKTAIAYIGYSKVSEGKKAIYLVEYNGTDWSVPYEWCVLSGYEDPIISSLSGYYDGSEFNVSYQLVERGESGAIESSQLILTQGDKDREGIVLNGIDYDANEVESGGTVNVSFSITNSGTKKINSLTAVAGSIETAVSLGSDIEPGETREIKNVSINLPAFSTMTDISFSVKSGTSNTSNEEIIKAGYTDVMVSLGDRTLIGSQEYLTIDVSNISKINASGVNLKVLADSADDGTIIFEHQFDGLDAGETQTMLCPMEYLESSTAAYVRVSTSNSELNEINNVELVVVNGETPVINGNRFVTLRSEKDECGTVSLVSVNKAADGDGAYEPGTRMTIKAVPQGGYVFTHWESDNGGEFEDVGSAETVFTTPNDDVTVTACFITGNQITKIELPASLKLNEGKGRYISPKIEPGTINGTAELLSWTSTSSNIATVDSHGYVKAVSVGTTKIIASDKSNPSVKAECTVTVTPFGTESIQFIYPNIDINGLGVKKKLDILVMPEGVEEDVVFSSSDDSVASVTADGTVISKGAGTAIITARVGEISDTCTVKVTNIVRSMVLSPGNITLDIGESADLTLSAILPEGASNVNTLVWESTDTSVATVSTNGIGTGVTVTAVGKGSAYIRATIGDVSRICYINVRSYKTVAPLLKAEKIRIVSSNGKEVRFEIRDGLEYEDGVTYNLYNDEKTVSPLTSPTIENAGPGGFTVKYSYQPSYDSTYYVTATEPNKDESARIRINIEYYRPFEVDDIPVMMYTGKEIKVDPVVKYNGKILTKDVDYTLSYPYDLTEAGTKNISISGKSGTDYSGMYQTITYRICHNLGKATIGRIQDQPYTGDEIRPSLSVSYKYKRPGAKKATTTYVSSSDYDAVYTNNTDIGTATVTLIGKGAYVGSVSKTFKITTIKMSGIGLERSIDSQYYTGEKLKPEIVLKDSNRNYILEEGKDYKVSYSNNINVSKGRKYGIITVSGKGIYKGTRKFSFYIYQHDFSEEITVTAGDANTAVYNKGKQLKPPVTVMLGDKKLKNGKDYRVTYDTNKGTPGEYGTVFVQGTGNYSGYVSQTFKIVKGSLNKAKIVFKDPKASYEYNGEPKEPAVDVVLNGKTLTMGTDYTVNWSNNVKAGNKAVVTVTGLTLEYGGSKSSNFKIMQRQIDKNGTGVTVTTAGSYFYTGDAIKPIPSVYVDEKLLEEGKDYKLSYSGNTNPGTKAAVNVSFKGNYKGSYRKPFTIAEWKFDESSISVTVAKAAYSPKGAKPEVTVKLVSSNNAKLKAGKAYKLVWSDNQKAGTGKVRIEPAGILEKVSGAQAVERTFKISAVNISDASVGKVNPVKYEQGKEMKPSITLKYAGKKLTEGTDYVVYICNAEEPGRGVVQVKGIGNFCDVRVIPFVIK